MVLDIPFIMITQAHELVQERVPEGITISKTEIGGANLLVVYFKGDLDSKIKQKIRRESRKYFSVDLKFVQSEEHALDQNETGIA